MFVLDDDDFRGLFVLDDDDFRGWWGLTRFRVSRTDEPFDRR